MRSPAAGPFARQIAAQAASRPQTAAVLKGGGERSEGHSPLSPSVPASLEQSGFEKTYSRRAVLLAGVAAVAASVGGASNTPPLASTAGEAHPKITALPVVADTAYLSFNASPQQWLRDCMAVADRSPGQAVYMPASDATVDPPSPTSRKRSDEPLDGAWWKVRRGSFEGFAAYRWTVEGIGAWAGVRMLLGDATEDADRETGRMRCFLMIGSAPLWAARGQGLGVYELAARILRKLEHAAAGCGLLTCAPDHDLVKPARLDLCVDHWGWEWGIADKQRFAARSRVRGDHADGGESETWQTEEGWQYGAESPTLYVGSRRSESRQLCIYDKTKEGEKSGKLRWLEPIWRAYGWEPGVKVWRAEVKFGGGWLKAHGMETLTLMRGCEREAWDHYTGGVRHVLGLTAKLRTEAASPVWSAIANATTDLSRGAWTWKPRKATRARDCVALGRMAAGCVTRLQWLLFNGEAEAFMATPEGADLWKRSGLAQSLGRSQAAVFAFVRLLMEDKVRRESVKLGSKLRREERRSAEPDPSEDVFIIEDVP